MINNENKNSFISEVLKTKFNSIIEELNHTYSYDVHMPNILFVLQRDDDGKPSTKQVQFTNYSLIYVKLICYYNIFDKSLNTDEKDNLFRESKNFVRIASDTKECEKPNMKWYSYRLDDTMRVYVVPPLLAQIIFTLQNYYMKCYPNDVKILESKYTLTLEDDLHEISKMTSFTYRANSYLKEHPEILKETKDNYNKLVNKNKKKYYTYYDHRYIDFVLLKDKIKLNFEDIEKSELSYQISLRPDQNINTTMNHFRHLVSYTTRFIKPYDVEKLVGSNSYIITCNIVKFEILFKRLLKGLSLDAIDAYIALDNEKFYDTVCARGRLTTNIKFIQSVYNMFEEVSDKNMESVYSNYCSDCMKDFRDHELRNINSYM